MYVSHFGENCIVLKNILVILILFLTVCIQYVKWCFIKNSSDLIQINSLYSEQVPAPHKITNSDFDTVWVRLSLSAGFNPRWNCTLSFQLQVPELALVRFVVEDHDHTAKNDFIGQFTLPFTSFRTGVFSGVGLHLRHNVVMTTELLCTHAFW